MQQLKRTRQQLKNLLILIIFFCNVITFGQTVIKHQIDTEYKECLDSSKNYTTKGMTDCVIKATEKWDTELNKTYKKLLELLTDGQKEKLKTVQRKWIEYCDKEVEFSNKLYYELGGTIWISVTAQTRLNLIRQRTLELTDYLSNLTIDK